MKKEFHTVKHVLASTLSSHLIQREGGFMGPSDMEIQEKMSFSPDDFLIIIRGRKAALLHTPTPKADKLGSGSSLLHYTG